MGPLRCLGLLIVVTVMALLPARPAEAGRFGTDESIRFIQDTAVKGAEGETLFLGYMTRTWNVFAGVWMEDAGYVLGVKGDDRKFYHVVPDELQRFQAAGLLPDPLPTYRLDAWDYLGGFLLWWIMLGWGLWSGVTALVRRWRGSEADTTAVAPPADTGVTPAVAHRAP